MLEVIPCVLQVQFITNNYLYGMQSTAIMMCAMDQLIAIVKPLYYICFKAKVTKYLICGLLVYWLLLVPFWVMILALKEELIWLASFSSSAVKITDSTMIKGYCVTTQLILKGLVQLADVPIGRKLLSIR